MKYLTWLVLNDGTCERVTEADIDPGAEAGVIDRALIPLSIGAPGLPRRPPHARPAQTAPTAR